MNLILIDDDLLVTTALKIILEADPELHVIATGTSGAEAIMLYDSVARNESTSESDIDIAVIIKREMDDEKNGNVLSICFGLIET